MCRENFPVIFVGSEEEPWVNKTGSGHAFEDDITFMGVGGLNYLFTLAFGLWRPCPWEKTPFKDSGNTTGGPLLQPC